MRKELGLIVSITMDDLVPPFERVFDPSLVVEECAELPFLNSKYPYIERCNTGLIIRQGNPIGIDGSSRDTSFYHYDPQTERVSVLSQPPLTTVWSPFTVVGNTLFFTGGLKLGTLFSRKTYSLDILNPEGGWTELPAELPEDLWAGRLHHHNGHLYLYGCLSSDNGYLSGIYTLDISNPVSWNYLDIDFNRKATHTTGAVDDVIIIGNYNTYGTSTFGKQYNVTTGELSYLPGAHILDDFPYCGDGGKMYMNTGKALLIQDKEFTPHINMAFKSKPFTGAIQAHSAVKREYMYTVYGSKLYRTRIYQP